MSTLINANPAPVVPAASLSLPVTASEVPEVNGVTKQSVLGIFHPYDSQIEIKETEGARIVKCLFQVNKATGKKVKESVYVKVPVAHITEDVIEDNLSELAPFIVSYLQTIEDEMIKADYKLGLTSIFTDGLNLDKIIDFLEESELGNRLNKEMIESWFNEFISPMLFILFASKLGLNLETKEDEKEADPIVLAKLESIMVAYKAKFASLASPKVSMKEEDCIAMLAVIDSIGIEKCGKLGSKFVVKLNKLLTKSEETLISL